MLIKGASPGQLSNSLDGYEEDQMYTECLKYILEPSGLLGILGGLR